MSQNPVLKKEFPTEQATDGINLVPILDEVEAQPRLDPTREKLNSLQQEVDGKNAEIDARLGALEPQTAKLAETIKKLGSKSGSLTSSLNRLKKRADETESRLNNLEPKNQSLDDKAEALSSKTLVLESSVAELDSRTGVLEEAQTAARQQVTGLEESADRLGITLRDTDHRLSDEIKTQETRLDVLEPSHAELTHALEETANRLGINLQDADHRLSEQMKTQESRLDVLEPSHEALARALEEAHTEAREQVKALEETANRLGLNLRDTDRRLTEQIKTQETRLDLLEPSHAELAHALEEAQTEARRQVKALEATADRLGINLRDTDRRVTEQIKTQETRLDLLEPSHAALARALEEAKTETRQQIKALDKAANQLGINLRDTDRRVTKQIKAHETRIALLEPGHEALKQDHGRLTGRTDRLETRAENVDKHLKRATVIAGGVLPVLVAVAVGAYFYGPSDQAVPLSLGKQLTVLEANVASQGQTLKANESTLDHLQKRVAALQVQVEEQSEAPAELKRAYEAVEKEIRNTDSRLVAMDSRLGAELEKIKERIYSDDGLSGAPVDLSTLRSESWLKTQDSGNYVIQLAGTYHKRGLAEFIARYQKVLPLEQLSYFKTVYRGRDWYVLLYGAYGKLDQALEAQESLPAVLQRNGPYIRTFGGVQQKLS